MEQLLTYKQAAEILGVVDLTVMRIARRGQLPIVKLGNNCTRIRYSDLVAFIDSRTRVREAEADLPESHRGADSARAEAVA